MCSITCESFWPFSCIQRLDMLMMLRAAILDTGRRYFRFACEHPALSACCLHACTHECHIWSWGSPRSLPVGIYTYMHHVLYDMYHVHCTSTYPVLYRLRKDGMNGSQEDPVKSKVHEGVEVVCTPEVEFSCFPLQRRPLPTNLGSGPRQGKVPVQYRVSDNEKR
jgi:hypothetical protein